MMTPVTISSVFVVEVFPNLICFFKMARIERLKFFFISKCMFYITNIMYLPCIS